MELTAPTALMLSNALPQLHCNTQQSARTTAQGKDKGSLQDCLQQISRKEKALLVNTGENSEIFVANLCIVCQHLANVCPEENHVVQIEFVTNPGRKGCQVFFLCQPGNDCCPFYIAGIYIFEQIRMAVTSY